MTVRQDFVRFERAARRWIGVLGLRDWEVEIVAEPIDTLGRAAEVSINRSARNARIVFNTRLRGERLVKLAPDPLALHEVLHILLCDTVELAAEAGWCMRADVQQAEHALIARLVNVLEIRR